MTNPLSDLLLAFWDQGPSRSRSPRNLYFRLAPAPAGPTRNSRRGRRHSSLEKTQESAARGGAQGASSFVRLGQLWDLKGISFSRPEKKSPNSWNLCSNGLVREEASSPSTRVCKPRLNVHLEGIARGSAIWRKGPGSSEFTSGESEAVMRPPELALESAPPPSPATAASCGSLDSLRSPVSEGRPRKRPASPPVPPLPFPASSAALKM